MMTARNTIVLLLVAAGASACSTPVGPEVRKVSTTVSDAPSGSAMAKGRILYARGEYALAIEEFRKVVREDPGSAAGYNALASSYDMIGRFDLASRNYELALAHAPDDGRIYRNMARSLQMQGRAGEAEALLAEWNTLNKAAGARQAAIAPFVAPQDASPPQAVFVAQPAVPVAGPAVESAKAHAAAPVPARESGILPAAAGTRVSVQVASRPTEPVLAIPKPVVASSSPFHVIAPVAPAPSAAVEPQTARVEPRGTAMAEPAQVSRLVPKLAARSKPAPSTPIAARPKAVVIKLDAPQPVRTAAVSAIRIMNAGARKGAAQNMQAYLARRGLPSRIADADRTLPQSWIVYPGKARAEALALQRRLPFPVRIVADNRVRRVTLLLGGDSARFRKSAKRA